MSSAQHHISRALLNIHTKERKLTVLLQILALLFILARLLKHLFRLFAHLGILGHVGGTHHDTGRGSLGARGLAEKFFGRDKDVGAAGVFGEHGQVCEDVDGRDVAGQDDDSNPSISIRM